MVNVGEVAVIRDGGKPKDRARKLVEEAAEAFSAWERYDRVYLMGDFGKTVMAEQEIVNECADVITAACGLMWEIFGVEVSLERALDECKRRNEKRGRVMV